MRRPVVLGLCPKMQNHPLCGWIFIDLDFLRYKNLDGLFFCVVKIFLKKIYLFFKKLLTKDFLYDIILM